MVDLLIHTPNTSTDVGSNTDRYCSLSSPRPKPRSALPVILSFFLIG